jgi:hypothetical protein
MNTFINIINKYVNPNNYDYNNDYFNMDNFNDMNKELRADLTPFEYSMFSLTQELEDILLPKDVSLFIIDDYYINMGLLIDIIYEYQIVDMTLIEYMRNIAASPTNYSDRRGVIKFYSVLLKKLYPNINDKQISLSSLYNTRSGMKSKNYYIYIFNYFDSIIIEANNTLELYKLAFQSLLNKFILDDSIVHFIEKKRFIYCIELFLQRGAHIEIDYLINNCIKPFNNNQPIINNNFPTNKREYVFTTFYRFYIIGLLIDEFFPNYITHNNLSLILNEILTFGNNSSNNIIIDYNDIGLDKYKWNTTIAFNKPLNETSLQDMEFFDGQNLLKFEDIKLNVIKYYSKVLRKNYYNINDNINIDAPFTDWDTYYDLKFNAKFQPYKTLSNQLPIYNEYTVYSSYFFADFNFKSRVEQNNKGFLNGLITKNGLNAQVGYNKFILFLNNLTAKELASLLLDENGKYIKYNIIMDYIDVFRKHGVKVNFNFYKLLYKLRPIIGGKVFVYILHTIITTFKSDDD